MKPLSVIDKLLSLGACDQVAFYSDKPDLDTLGATICALLNYGGGQVIIGLNAEREPGPEPPSERDITQLLLALHSDKSEEGVLSPDAVWDVTEETLNGNRVVLIEVPCGPERPHVFVDDIFVRRKGETCKATRQEITELVRKRYQQGPRWESDAALDITMAQLDRECILETARLATENNRRQFRDIETPYAVLEDLGLTCNDGRFTYAAVVLFAKEAGQIIPQTQVRVTVYQTDKPDSASLDDKFFSGHLFANLEGVWAMVKNHIRVSSEIPERAVERVDRASFPPLAVREGICNALLHRDYASFHGRVTIHLYPRKMEIWSYGRLPSDVTVKSITNLAKSFPVNPTMATVAFYRGAIEFLGKGALKMVQHCREASLPDPVWKESAGGVLLTLIGQSGPGEVPIVLNLRQVDLLRNMRHGHRTSLAEFRKSHDVSERSIRNDLSRLAELGYLNKQGQGRSTYYVRTDKPLV